MNDTMPTKLEDRAAFIVRLRAAVAWVNKNQADALEVLSHNLKERCQQVLDRGGGRSDW